MEDPLETWSESNVWHSKNLNNTQHRWRLTIFLSGLLFPAGLESASVCTSAAVTSLLMMFNSSPLSYKWELWARWGREEFSPNTIWLHCCEDQSWSGTRPGSGWFSKAAAVAAVEQCSRQSDWLSHTNSQRKLSKKKQTIQTGSVEQTLGSWLLDAHCHH